MTPEIRLELQRLLSALCDGALTEAQYARLEELIGGDIECRRCYLEYLDMHARLLVHPHLRGGETLPPGVRPLAGPIAGVAGMEASPPAAGPRPREAVPRDRGRRRRWVP